MGDDGDGDDHGSDLEFELNRAKYHLNNLGLGWFRFLT